MAKKTEQLEKIPPAFLAERPSFVTKGDVRGADHLKKGDMEMPRILLAQQMSPQVTKGNPAFLKDLQVGEMFNSLSSRNYGEGPLTFVIIRADRPRGVEFVPRTEGKGVKDWNVPLDDPRMQFTTGPDGKQQKPKATKFYDFIVVLEHEGDDVEVVALSLKGSALRVAKRLNTLMGLRNAPCFAGRYELRAEMQTNPKGTFAVFVVSNAGWVTEEERFREYEKLYTKFKDVEVKIGREDDEEEDDSFDPDKM